VAQFFFDSRCTPTVTINEKDDSLITSMCCAVLFCRSVARLWSVLRSPKQRILQQRSCSAAKHASCIYRVPLKNTSDENYTIFPKKTVSLIFFMKIYKNNYLHGLCFTSLSNCDNLLMQHVFTKNDYCKLHTGVARLFFRVSRFIDVLFSDTLHSLPVAVLFPIQI